MGETVTRTVSGLVYIILLTSAIFYSSYSFLALFGIFLIISVTEFCDLLQIGKTAPIIAAVILFMVFVNLPLSETSTLLLLAATLFASVKCILFLFEDKRQHFGKISKYILVTGYIIFPFILLAKIPFANNNIYTPEIIFSIFILIWTNDTFAFIVGKSIGKHKLFERISPKKTVEGFLGGIIFASIAGYIIARFYTLQPVILWIGIALIIGIFGTVGDLVESKFKRVATVKDSGIIMPGHGGILDRLDSVIFAAPFVFLFYQIIYYVS